MKGDQGFGLQTKQKRSYCQFLVSPYELFNCSYLIAGNHTKEQAFAEAHSVKSGFSTHQCIVMSPSL